MKLFRRRTVQIAALIGLALALFGGAVPQAAQAHGRCEIVDGVKLCW